ncbi:MAG: hypothetical protein ACRDRS_00670 [Pseudonocardiaceae bacterium]
MANSSVVSLKSSVGRFDDSPIADVVDPWDRHLGLLWARVLRQQEIRLDGRVVELGPGFSAKIGHGLAEVGFHGEVVLVEPNGDARRSAAGKYRRLLPQAHVRTRPRLLRHAGEPVRDRVDLVVANHVLDDLFLSAHLSFRDSDQLFAEMRPGRDCSDVFLRTWRRILGDSASVDRVIADVVDDLVRHLTATAPGCFIMNQYPSWRQGERCLGAIHEIGLAALRLLARRLERDLSRPVCLRQLGDRDMYWLISVDPDVDKHRRMRA